MRIAQFAPLCRKRTPEALRRNRTCGCLAGERTGRARTRGHVIRERGFANEWKTSLRMAESATFGTQGVDPNAACSLSLEALAKRAADFDIIHSHVDWLPLPLLSRLGVPFVTTAHGRLDLSGLPDVAREFSSASFVAISDNQPRQLPDAKWIATIQHGLPSCLFRPSYEPGSYLAFLGRLTAEKGPLDAIRIAQASEMPLRIAAKIPRAETAFCTPLSLRLRHGEKLSCLPGWNGS